MRTSFLFCLFTLTVLSYCSCESDTKSIEMPAEQWKAFKAQHGKNYPEEEDAKRFEIFKNNLKMIEEHNAKYAKGETTYTMGINQFSDLFEHEKAHSRGLLQPETK